MTSRIVRDFLERISGFLLKGSLLYLVVSLLYYKLDGPDGFRSFFPLSGMVWAGVTLCVLLSEFHRGLTRVILHLPVGRRELAKTYCALVVGVPAALVMGLTLIAWLATSLGGGIGWISVPMAVAWAFLVSSLCFCIDALENSGSRYGGEPAPRWAQVAIWTLFVVAWLAVEYVFFGSLLGSFYFLLSPDTWQPKHLLVSLALGAAAATLGFARARALLTARRAHSKSRLAAPGRAIRMRLSPARHLTGFAAVTASCLWMPIAIVGALGAISAIDMGIRNLAGLSDSYPHMDWRNGVAGGAIFACVIAIGFTATVPRFANFRVLKGLPMSTRRLGACVTLLPAILVLIQVALAFPLLHILDPVAATNLFLPLVGAVGIGALLCPVLLVRPHVDIWFIAAFVVNGVLLGCWLTVSALAPVLKVLTPLVLAGGLYASWAISRLVFRHALAAAADKPPPLQRVSPRSGN